MSQILSVFLLIVTIIAILKMIRAILLIKEDPEGASGEVKRYEVLIEGLNY